MSILDSLFVGVFGMSVVFIVLVGLSLLVKLQSALVNRFSHKKSAEALAQSACAADAQNNESAVIEETVKQMSVVNICPGARPQQEFSGSVGTIKRFNAILNGKVYEAEVEEVRVPTLQASADMPQYIAAPLAPAASPPPAKKTVSAPAPAVGMVSVASVSAGSEVITAPVPGTVLDVKTAVGARVKCGEILVLLEAMKMENEIVATRDGIVTQILVSKGASVSSGTPLIAMSDGGM